MTARSARTSSTKPPSTVTVARRVFEELTAADGTRGRIGRRVADRRRHGLDPAGHRPGRQPVRRARNWSPRASAICSTRASCPRERRPPVYHAIALERRPTLRRRRTASAPFSSTWPPRRCARGAATAVLTVPLAPRQREIEREIDTLNRRVLVGAVVRRAARRLASARRWPAASPIRSRGSRRATRADRRRSSRRPRRGRHRRRTPPARRRLQQHGGHAGGAAGGAGAGQSAEGLERNGAAGGARDQESADAHSTRGRAPAARARRPRPPLGAVFDQCVGTILGRSGCCARSRPSSPTFAGESRRRGRQRRRRPIASARHRRTVPRSGSGERIDVRRRRGARPAGRLGRPHAAPARPDQPRRKRRSGHARPAARCAHGRRRPTARSCIAR